VKDDDLVTGPATMLFERAFHGIAEIRDSLSQTQPRYNERRLYERYTGKIAGSEVSPL